MGFINFQSASACDAGSLVLFGLMIYRTFSRSYALGTRSGLV
jgi:hypothetical protein